MNIIFVEGERDKSAYKFWELLNKHYLSGLYEIRDIPGSGKIYYKTVVDELDNILNISKANNFKDKYRIILVIDKASGLKVFNILESIRNKLNELLECGIDIKIEITPEYCFEEMVVVSTEREILTDNENRRFIKENYIKNINYAQTNEYIQMVNKRGRWINREKYAAEVLASSKKLEDSLIIKGNIGKCWTGNKSECDNSSNCGIECKCRIADVLTNGKYSSSGCIERMCNYID